MAIAGIPSGLLVQQGSGRVYVSWNQTTGATSYSVQRSTDNITYAVVNTPSAPHYSDTTVTVGTQYFYKVASVNGDGTSSYCSAQSAVPTLVGQNSLGELRLRAQQRADRVNSPFVSTGEWNYYINQSYYELYDLLITVYEDYYVAPRLSITTTGSQLYDLPNGNNYNAAPALYKLYGVDLGLNSSTNAFVTLKKFDFIQRNRYIFPQIASNVLAYFNLEYRLVGGQIMIIPNPASGQTFGIWYFPRLNALLADTDIMDGISGWDEYVIVDAARKALAKEESDTSVLMGEKQMLIKRIMDSASNRDAGQGDCVSDMKDRGGWNSWMDNFSGGWGGM
jgi:hypothetical protein